MTTLAENARQLMRGFAQGLVVGLRLIGFLALVAIVTIAGVMVLMVAFSVGMGLLIVAAVILALMVLIGVVTR